MRIEIPRNIWQTQKRAMRTYHCVQNTSIDVPTDFFGPTGHYCHVASGHTLVSTSCSQNVFQCLSIRATRWRLNYSPVFIQTLFTKNIGLFEAIILDVKSSLKACTTTVRFHASRFVSSRCVTILFVYSPMFHFGCNETGLILAWFSPSFTVMYRIYPLMQYYRNYVLMHFDGTQRTAWKTHPCGVSFSPRG